MKRSQLQVTDSPIPNTWQYINVKTKDPCSTGRQHQVHRVYGSITKGHRSKDRSTDERQQGLRTKIRLGCQWISPACNLHVIWLRSSVTSTVSTGRICLKLITVPSQNSSNYNATVSAPQLQTQLLYYEAVKLHMCVHLCLHVCYIHNF